MGTVLIATDADWIHDEVDAALGDESTEVVRVSRGDEAVEAVHRREPELVILDLQIGNMGGMAVCMHLRHDEGMGRIDPVPILMLLDRAPDVFLAKRSGADGWLIKPLDSMRLRRAADTLRKGERYTEHAQVETVSATPPSS